MLAIIQQRLDQVMERPTMAVFLALVISMSNVGVVTPARAAINLEPVGQGFTTTPSDLAYILKQIKIAEAHVAAGLSPDSVNDPANCQALVGLGPNQIPSPLLSFGLRTVDGQCNNLQPFQAHFGASDQVFPRLTVPSFDKQVEDAGVFGPPGFGLTNYNQTSGPVVDSQPRIISNLIVDQTSSNPAAVFVAENPARTQGAEGVIACVTHPTLSPPDCVPEHETLFIPNVTTDVGLSPPFNSLFTIFGQFFDHGLDKITNGGNGQVFVPLKDDDPLVAGPDHIFQDTPGVSPGCSTATPTPTCDDLPPQLRFMTLTRGTVVNPDPSCVDPLNSSCYRSAPNTDTPFVDQSQTYTSHSSHQVFLRDYVLVDHDTNPATPNVPRATGKFLSTADGGMATWAMIKTQAANVLGLQLVDVDVNNIPMVAADYYGNFIPGTNGFPQYVTATGLVEGNPAAPVPAPANVLRIETAFLNDIAHSAAPGNIGAPKVPDSDTVAGGSLDQTVPPGSYDNELLNLHYICGDGRCNENIALTAIHQIFHMEHDRLIDDITATLNDPVNVDLLNDYKNLAPISASAFTFEERLFQAARFVTEMQYQHLVFEEFARKVQPAINPFQPFAFNQTGADPAITAEFAHAVYRFGHSMLNDTIPRKNLEGSPCTAAPSGSPPFIQDSPECLSNDIPLLDGFLNPAEFNNGGAAGLLADRQATGAIIMGLSDQVGNEIDEFVADTLRNNLLGLPLDLPSLNMTRARSEGVPSLNNVRKQIFAATNDGQLAPYTNWIDFEQNIKHSVSLVNFVAAYGKHPTILAATTLEGKRIAAQLIINGGIGAPADSSAFLFSTGAWSNIAGVSQTGVDDVDLWVGGLAENTNLFGGLLGSTFNYVFEKQLTDLQNNDRLYYLARTPGMNLRTQLEGNSFAELVMRNTNPYTHTLKADPFATADCKFQLANLSATVDGFNTFGATVADDPTTECNETALLIRLPDGTIKYRATNSIDPPGINGQSVFNGTELADWIYGGNDNDTFWGGLGNDTINGGGGDDIVLGGDGDDIITDFAGADILKGGPGNDAIDGGPGDDILMPGLGKDFTNGGQNINETFASEGDDFAIAGKGEDAVFGDGGDDWEEGDDAPDLLIGDNSSLFFDDHNLPGHDVLIGQGGDDDYDMEGGDDIGVSGPGVEKIAGAAGYDWEIGLSDPQPQVMDLALPLLGVPLPINAVRDKFNEVEALSGWKFNDTLYGDSVIPSAVGGAVAGGFIGCDALDADGVARIAGLELLVTPEMRTEDPATIAATSATFYCGLTAEPGFLVAGDLGGVWGQGNILLGGAGSDTIEGRGANDIIDGDKYLNVRLSVRSGGEALDSDGVDIVTDGSGVEIGSTDLMVNKDNTSRSFGPGTAGMTLQQAVFARKVNPGNIVLVREILLPTPVAAPDCNVIPVANRVNCDKAVYSGPSNEYTFTARTDGSVIVTDNADPAAPTPITPAVPRNTDGIDILWNMEQLSFCPVPGAIRGTCNTVVSQGGAPRTTVSIIPTPSITGPTNFGGVVVNTAPGVNRTLTVRNTGVTNLIIPANGVSITGDSSFTVVGGTCLAGATIAQTTGSCTVIARFAPTSGGVKNANLVITHNGMGLQTTIPVIGTGTVPLASLTPNPVAFGSLQVNIAAISALTQVVNLTNNGDGRLTVAVNGISVTGAGFTRLGTGCATVAPSSSCAITVRFLPTIGGNLSGNLRVISNSGGTAGTILDVPLSGIGTISAANDAASGTSTLTGPAVVQASGLINVRNNDSPVNTGTVSIVSGVTFTPDATNTIGGATATAEAATATGATTGTLTHVRFRITPSQQAGLTNAQRQLSKRGTYAVTYQLTNGGATATAVVTLTLN